MTNNADHQLQIPVSYLRSGIYDQGPSLSRLAPRREVVERPRCVNGMG